MKEQLQRLWDLQCLEQRKKAVSQRRETVSSDEVREIWQQVQQLLRQAAQDRQKLEAQKLVCDAKEEQVSSLARQLQALEKRLYSGELTHVKEMEQLKVKCEELKRDIGVQEDSLFETMEVCEVLSESVKAAEQQTEERKRCHAKKQQELAARSKQAEQEMEAAALDCQALEAIIDPSLLSNYQRLKSKMANPVAKLENGICSGCRMSIPTRQSSAGQNAVVYCDNCGRILLQ